jgi:murein DD-endopeptidase MepM/ murein hydrolase activator NlpD
MSGFGPFTAKGRISQDFGPGISAEPDGYIVRDAGGWLRGRRTAFAGSGAKRHDIHLGLDIAAPVGTPVLAPEKCTVLAHGYDKVGGYYILLGIQKGTLVYNGHLKAFVAKVGAVVPRGATVALVGATGGATGPHDHVGVYHGAGSWRGWFTSWYAYNPERLMVGGDMAGVPWIKPK